MRRSRFLAVVGAAAGLGPRAAEAQSAIPLRVAATANDTYAEAYYADALGAFPKAGLDATIQTFTAGGPVTAAVAGDAADVGIAGAPTIAAATLHGIPFRFIASGAIYLRNHPATGIVVATDGPIKTARDFEGRSIASGAIKDGNWLAAVAWIDQHGGDASKVEFVEMPFAAMGPAIKRGTIAGGTIPEPSLTRSLRSGGLRIFARHFDVYGNGFMIGGWFARAEWIAANPTAARRYVGVVYDVARWANAHPDQSATILAKVTKIDDETMRTMVRSRYGETLTPAMLQSQLDLAVKYGVIERPVDAAAIIANV